MRRAALGAALGAAAASGVFIPRSAAAGPREDSDRADALFAEGGKLVAAGKIAEARDKYREAFGLKPSADIACNLGATEVELKEYPLGAEHLDQCIRVFPASATEKQKEAARAKYETARAATVKLEVRANEAGAAILIDGKPRGETPRETAIYVEPGPHTVKATLSGFNAPEQAVEGNAGEARALSFRLVKEAVVTPPPPITKRSLAPAVVAFVVGGVGVAIGATMIGLHSGAVSDAEDLGQGRTCRAAQPEQDCQDIVDAVGKANSFGDASTAGFVVGGVGIGAGVGLVIWALTGTPSTQQAVRIGPWVGGGIAARGFVIGGTF